MLYRWTFLGFNSPACWQNKGSNKAWFNTESRTGLRFMPA
jgi:hypothetical protein